MKDTKKLITSLTRAGYVVTRGRRHYRVETPEGPVFLPHTPSDSRGMLNARAQLRRKGVSL